jgi:HD-like signal output (HDOD) protein
METHLNDAIFLRVGIESILDIALAHYAQVANDVNRRRSQHVVVDI